MEAVNKIVDQAKSYTGYLEKASNSGLDDYKANAGSKNYTKFARDYSSLVGANFQAQPWCAMYVSMLYVYQYGADKAKQALCGNVYASCSMAVNAFKKQNRFFTTPAVGDWIIFKDSSGPCHVGIVTRVGGGIVYTNEGNTSAGSSIIPNGGGVCDKSYKVSNSNIYGYLRPRYELIIPNPVTGWVKDVETKFWWYRNADGSYPANAWRQIDNKWYYFDKEGYMVTGWLDYENAWYYLKSDGVMASNEILTIKSALHGNEIFCFAKDGHVLLTDARGAMH